MATTVPVYVEDIDTALLTYTDIRLWRDTSPTGPFTTGAIPIVPLVAGQRLYEYPDSGGDPETHYYRYSLYNAIGPVESAQSAVIRPSLLTLRRLRLDAAREAGAGFAATCSALGTTTFLEDNSLGDSGVDAHFLEGGWIYRPNAVAAGDKLRRVDVSGFVLTPNFGLTPNRAWTNAPILNEAYEVYNYAAPVDWPGMAFSWDRAIRTALTTTWFVDQINLGVGTSAGKRRYSMSEFTAVERDTIRRVLLRTTDTNGNDSDLDADKGGRFWRVIENGADGLTLELSSPPATDESVIVEFNRTYDEMYIDTDTTPGPQRLIVLASVYRFFEGLNRLQGGAYAGEEALWRKRFLGQYRPPAQVIRGA